MSNYNPLDWYWMVSNSTTQVWSSARVMYVPMSDATLLAWENKGNRPTRINSAPELYNVLYAQWLPQVFANGMPVTSSSNPTLNGTYSLDGASVANISGISTGIAAGKGLPGGGSSFVYGGHLFTSAEFLNFASAVENYIYNYNIALATLVSTGSGSLPSLPIGID